MEKAHECRDLDLTGAARGVWLVKVPKYLSERWMEAEGTGEVGKLRINKAKVAGGKPEVIFTLRDDMIQPKTPADHPVPKDHKFILNRVANQSLSVLSRDPQCDPESLQPGEYPDEKVAIEGYVIQRAECRPMGDASYMNLKRIALEQSNQPKNEVKQLDRVVQSYKPGVSSMVNRQQEREKKEKVKNIRIDRDRVQDMLFNAFEKHQYYNIRDLVRITQQPVTYLKEILKEICTYNTRAPHKNMWELKPEYRHYKSDDMETS